MEAGAPDHVRDVEHAAVLEQRLAVAHADDARHAPDAGGRESSGFSANERAAPRWTVGARLAPDRRVDGQHPVEHERGSTSGARKSRAAGAVDAERNVPGVAARQPDRGDRARGLERDLRAGVAGARRRGRRPSRSCDGLRYSLEWSWTIPGPSSARTPGRAAAGSSPSRRRPASPRTGGRPPRRRSGRPSAREPLHPHAGSHRQREARRVRLEVVRHLVLRRESGAAAPGTASRSSPSKRGGVKSRSESQRRRQESPTRSLASRITNAMPARAQVIADREAGLAAADDDRRRSARSRAAIGARDRLRRRSRANAVARLDEAAASAFARAFSLWSRSIGSGSWLLLVRWSHGRASERRRASEESPNLQRHAMWVVPPMAEGSAQSSWCS